MKKDWEKEFDKNFDDLIWICGLDDYCFHHREQIKSFISNLLVQKEKDCQEYKDYYDRRKERDCKIAQANYDLGWKKALKQFEEIVGEDRKYKEGKRWENNQVELGYNQAKQEIRDKLKTLTKD